MKDSSKDSAPIPEESPDRDTRRLRIAQALGSDVVVSIASSERLDLSRLDSIACIVAEQVVDS